jgi:hypothetical protein
MVAVEGLSRPLVQTLTRIIKQRKEIGKNVNAHMGIDRLLDRRMFGFCAVFVLGVSRPLRSKRRS